MRMAAFRVSVIVPAYNEGGRLPGFLDAVARLGARVTDPTVEFVVVDDGSDPAHRARHSEAVEQGGAILAGASAPHALRFLQLDRNVGKGAAIRAGWRNAASSARWLGFVDADGAVPARELWRLIGMLREGGPDMLAGARVRMAGRRVDRSLVRHLQGRVFATLAEQLLPNGFYDTQCGLKLVQADRVRPGLDAFQEDRWLFDLELISWIRRQAGTCAEEPIDWSDPGGSKVIPILDPMKMLLGLLSLRRRQATWRAKPV
jgi:dolichyl-phosphate beta-glucosyltransferase